MLDCAANATVFWHVDTIRDQFAKTCEESGRNPVEALAEFLEPDADPEAFWDLVKTNLQASRLRLVSLTASLPLELRRIHRVPEQTPGSN